MISGAKRTLVPLYLDPQYLGSLPLVLTCVGEVLDKAVSGI